MKINYHNEDYKNNIFNIVVYIFSIAFIICWWFFNGKPVEIGALVFCGILILFLLILLYFSIRRYRKQLNKRKLNLFIIENGTRIQGRITRIYDQYSSGTNMDSEGHHNVTAEIEYQQEYSKQIVAVDDLAINIRKLESYHNKIVSIYVYNDMHYIDIVNDYYDL